MLGLLPQWNLVSKLGLLWGAQNEYAMMLSALGVL